MLRSALMLIAFLAVAAPIGVHAQPVGSEFQVNTYTTGYQQKSSVATDSDGDFVVVWGSYGQDGRGTWTWCRRRPEPTAGSSSRSRAVRPIA
jgi:hypothetical protein